MTHKLLTIATLILFSMSSGCRLIMHQLKPNFFAGNDAYTAAQSVKSKIGAPFKVRTIEITEEKFKMTVESPDNPRNIDEYIYIGLKATGPNPLQFDPYDAKETARMSFDEIDFTVIPQIVENALDKARIEGGKVTEIMFYTRAGNKFGWDVTVQGTRERASLRADMKGNIVGADLSQTVRAADYKVLNETELNKASDAIKAKFGADAKISDLHINEKEIRFMAKNPQNEKEVYNYNFGIDGLKRSAPIALPESMMSDTTTFVYSDINLVDVLSLAQKAQEKLQMPNGEITSISYLAFPVLVKKPISDRLPGVTINEVSSEMRWTVTIKNGSDEKTARFDKQLNEVADR